MLESFQVSFLTVYKVIVINLFIFPTKSCFCCSFVLLATPETGGNGHGI